MVCVPGFGSGPLFAEASVSFDGATFAELAAAGDKGVIIALVIAYIALVLVFAGLYAFSYWCEMRRYERKEIDREKELVRLRSEENAGRERMAEAVTALTENVKQLTELVRSASSELGRVASKVDRLGSVWES